MPFDFAASIEDRRHALISAVSMYLLHGDGQARSLLLHMLCEGLEA